MILGLGLPCSGTATLAAELGLGHEYCNSLGTVDWQLIYPKGWIRKPFGSPVQFDRSEVTKIIIVKRHPLSMVPCFCKKVLNNSKATNYIPVTTFVPDQEYLALCYIKEMLRTLNLFKADKVYDVTDFSTIRNSSNEVRDTNWLRKTKLLKQCEALYEAR